MDINKMMIRIDNDIKKSQERIDYGHQLLSGKEVDALDYKFIKPRYENENLLKEKASLQAPDDNYLKYFDFGVQLLKNLDCYYDIASLKVKQQIVCSIYPKKLIYEKNNFRTPKINSVDELMTLKNNVLKEQKKD